LLGLQNVGSVYMGYWFLQGILSATFNALGHLLASSMPDLVVATQLQGLVLTFAFLFGGIFVHGSVLPAGWKWIYNINPLPKAIYSALDAQYFFSTAILTIPNSQLAGISGDNASGTSQIPLPVYLSQYVCGIPQDSYWTQVGWIFLIMWVLRLGAILSIQFISHVKR